MWFLARFALCLAIVTLAAPAARAQNQFPDVGLWRVGDYASTSFPAARHEPPAWTFTSAGSSAILFTTGQTNTDLLDAWPASEDRQVVLNVLSYSAGDLQCRFRNGAYVNMGIAGTGQTTAVTITAGSSATVGLLCRGTGPATLSISLGVTGSPAVSITP